LTIFNISVYRTTDKTQLVRNEKQPALTRVQRPTPPTFLWFMTLTTELRYLCYCGTKIAVMGRRTSKVITTTVV